MKTFNFICLALLSNFASSAAVPSSAPSRAPTTAPARAPTRAPTNPPTRSPTRAPTDSPTRSPTRAPTDSPTRSPTRAPTNPPTPAPTRAPTNPPTPAPTRAPTNQPTPAPTRAPTNPPTRAPTDSPTRAPTRVPTNAPTRVPTNPPTRAPTTSQPSPAPTTSVPTPNPTTSQPTASPTTATPTLAPTTSQPSHAPTVTKSPTSSPFPTSTPITAAPTPIQTLNCPSNGGSFSFAFEGPIKFSISDESLLCLLVQVSPDGKHFKPLGRSYNGYDWEASSGEFSTLQWSCSVDSCLTTLPSLATGAVYTLTTFESNELNLTKSDEVARFLEQATFGATSADIDSMDTSNLLRSFASWIEKQQKEVPMTSHRALFRRHMNDRMEVATQQGAVTHPCQIGTRYRRFAFSSLDQEKLMNITTVGTKKILSVDGFVRTVVDGPIHSFWKPSIVWADGSYEIAKGSHPSDMRGAWLRLKHPSAGTSSLEVACNGTYGNPAIQFDSSINVTPNVLVNLSLANAKPIDERYFTNQRLVTRTSSTPITSFQELILTQTLLDAVCDSLGEPGNPIDPVFALFNGSYWIHDPRFETISNTVESPSPDGGGKVIRETFNIVESDRGAVCANVPRTFLNENSCAFSNAVTACAAESYDPFKSLRTQLWVVVSPKTIRDIFTITGNGTASGASTRYVYAVDGLRIQSDVTVVAPCQRNAISRWAPISCTGAAASVNATVHSIFSRLLFVSRDPNASVRDVNNNSTTTCPTLFANLVGFEVQDEGGQCWKNVHPDHLNVYDFTYWTRLDSHPGNSVFRNPIKEFAEAGSTTLVFPSWHGMDRWSLNKKKFGYVGRLGDRINYYDLPRELRSTSLNEYYGFTPEKIAFPNSTGAIVCGSPFEEANDPTLGGSRRRGAFGSLNPDFVVPNSDDFLKQKRMIWTEAALTARDQLRQRTAWVLSQILVVSPDSVDDGLYETESMTTYYDIFIRNAFGNYRDVLKEVAYSPLMAEMLTYLESKSIAHTWRTSRKIEYPDENFAREVMQLFSVGLAKVHPDGTRVIDEQGETSRVYTNDDIVEYARVWTGFERRGQRGNIEDAIGGNRIDPMQINIDHRDIFPKMGLDRKYIGDGIPLCVDLPDKHFLKVGATYRLLGRSSTPESQTDPIEWASDVLAKRLKLQSNGGSRLFSKLCGSQNPTSCTLAPKVVLDQNILCSGVECAVDTVRVLEVSDGVFYEYVRPPCVYQAFFENPKMIVRRNGWRELTCAAPRTLVASTACCKRLGPGVFSSNWTDMYWGERTTFATADQRCNQNFCNRASRPSCNASLVPSLGSYCNSEQYFWTLTSCKLRVKIDKSGNVAIVHAPINIEAVDISRKVQNETKTFFRVDWTGNVESVISNCEAVPACRLAIDGACLCDVYVKSEQIFFDGNIFGRDRPSRESVLAKLYIGAFNPTASGSNLTSRTLGDVKKYTVNGSLTSESIFEVIDDYGVRQWRKNMMSTVHIEGLDLFFRNPVHFISLSDGANHEAHDETDAALDHYFYHPNTAPFLALRFAQRFGISNPSPGFISRIAGAFRRGSHTFSDNGGSISYGSGKYGDIGAMVACILLDREARTTLLDADPTHGSLKEPLIKLIGLMRALEFRPVDNAGFVDFDSKLNFRIGQMAHAIPNVFSFFLPEYKPSGPVAQATLVAPEAQVLTGPRTIDFLNGILSLIKYGLSPCLGGFGAASPKVSVPCQNYAAGVENSEIKGRLTYFPRNNTTPHAIINDLAKLLTSGRLSRSSRQLIEEVIRNEPNRTLGVIKAQQLVVLSPEFHSTNVARKSGEARPEPVATTPSVKPYKAVVYVLLAGGMDSFNMLVPHTCATKNAAGQSLLEQYYAMRSDVAITNDERSRVINATGQACDQFVVHQDLEIVERLYKAGDLAFFANTGVLNRPSDRVNYNAQSRTTLFAHNTMQEETQKVDPFDGAIGTGVLGRMCDTLQEKGYRIQPITVEDSTIATVGSPGSAVDPLIVSPYGTNAFNPLPDGETFNPRPYLDELNNATSLQSSVFGETWSMNLQTALVDNEALVQALSTTQLKTAFPDTEYGNKFKAASTLIASHTQRGTDREVIFVSLSGWDHHSQMKGSLATSFQRLNTSLTAFEQEMKAQGHWDKVSLVITSDFGRTLTANSGNGTDHGWGGNYFVMGGAVNGGRIHGAYPSDITDDGPLNIGRGRLLPTLSWESILNPIAQWMGVETEEELNYCLPNRIETGTKIFMKEEVFMV